MNNDLKRLYIFTGKGGVGKTTLAISFANYLKKSGKKVQYATFEDNSFISGKEGSDAHLEFDSKILSNFQSARNYISKKLGSEMVASWIVRTHFFKSMLNMLPGFSYLITLGELMDELQRDKELITVFDSPSSGHALTMFESLQIFRDIFQTGLLFEDILKMIELLGRENFLKIFVCTVPTYLSLQEACELKEKLKSLKLRNVEIIANNILKLDPLINKTSVMLPHFLERKIQIEKEVMDHYQDQIGASLPHITSLECSGIVEKMYPYMASLF